jgi:uncharacterized membrane protein YfhO
VKLQVIKRDILVVNQNFDFGFRTDPPRKLINVGGLLGVEVSPQDSRLTIFYLPFNFMLGLWVSLLGLMVIAWDWCINI